MRIGEMIKRFRDENGITQQTFADHCEVSKSYVSLLESGKSTRSDEPIIPSIEVAHRIASYMKISIDSLFDSDGGKQSIPPINEPRAVKIPVLGQVPAGVPFEAIECIIDYEEIPIEMARSGEHFGLQIKGDSMAPRILDGDVVIVRKQPTVESGDVAIIMVNGDDATCKRIMYHENGLSLVSINPAFQPRYFTAQEVERLPIQVIGKVVELRGKF